MCDYTILSGVPNLKVPFPEYPLLYYTRKWNWHLPLVFRLSCWVYPYLSCHQLPPAPAHALAQMHCLGKGLKHVPAAPAVAAELPAPTGTPAPEVGGPPLPVEEQDLSTASSPVNADAAQQPAEESLRGIGVPPSQGEESGPTIADSPLTAGSAEQPAEDTFRRDSAGENRQGDDMAEAERAQVVESMSDIVQEESEIATGEKKHEVVAKMDEPKTGSDLLLELIRSFRGGMLRVDSNLRGAMFRSLRYLVGARISQ